jgi:YD repeat-containing protein
MSGLIILTPPTDKIATITCPDASQIIFTYNNLDRMTAMQDAIGTASYSYDDAGRLTSMTDSNGFTVSYGYDASGNLTTLTYPGNKVVTYIYDALNRMKTVTINWLSQTATYADYDAAGRLPGFTNFNGTQTTYSYDNANRLTAISNKKADSSVIAGYTFTLDGNGNRTSVAQSEPYAPSIGEGDATYTYNTQKNRLLSTSAGGSFGYDDEGQLQSGYSTDYTFDYEHRLKTIGGTQFYYDGGGKRLKALRDGVTTRYIYDAGGTLLAEADANKA